MMHLLPLMFRFQLSSEKTICVSPFASNGMGPSEFQNAVSFSRAHFTSLRAHTVHAAAFDEIAAARPPEDGLAVVSLPLHRTPNVTRHFRYS